MFTNYKILKFKDASHPAIGSFIKRNHYSGSISRGNKFVFALIVNGKLKGVATFGTPVGKSCQMYSSGSGVVLECKRFCLAPNAPKNTASFFMSKCLKELKKNKSIDSIISYADPEQKHNGKSHEGTIYKASNFRFLGEQNKGSQAIKIKGQKKPVHLRVAYQKINGVYTKTAQETQEMLQNGTAKYISLAPKLIFKYALKK